MKLVLELSFALRSIKRNCILVGIIFLLGFHTNSHGQITQTFTSSGTFTAPAGVTSVLAQAWGGGGGGAASAGGIKNRAGGGGGAFASGVVAVVPNTVYTYTVGLGGSQGVAGGSTNFNAGSVIALGGASGNSATGGAGGSGTASTGTTKFSGGAAANSSNTNNHGGSGGGGSALLTANGGTGVSNLLGVGGAGGVGTANGGAGGNNASIGANGSAPGGGGGGAGDNGANSGSGAAGQIILTYTCPTYALSSTIISSEVCVGATSSVTLSSTAIALPVGSYVVSYTLGAPNAGSYTAAMSVVTAGTGNFTTVALPSIGTTSILITNLTSATCGNSISLNNAASITVRPAPTASISGTTAVCQSATAPLITFTNAMSLPVTVTYRINSGSNLNIAVAAGSFSTVSASTTTSGTFIYTLVSVAYQTSPSCLNVQTGSATIIVNPLPTASITGTTAVCQNATAPVVTFTGAAGTAPYTFTYNINGGASQTITTISGNSITLPVSTSVAGPFAYNMLSVRDASATLCLNAQSGTATVTVNPLPTATIAGTTSVCRNGSSPVITFTGATGTAPYTFTYNINGGANQTITTTSGNSVTLSAPTTAAGSFAYNLVSVRDASSTLCLNPQGGSATITVNPLPTATVTGTTAVCQNGTSPVVTFTGATGTAPYTFTYNINGGANQTITTTSGNSVTLSAPTTVAGTFAYNLINVRDASSTLCLNAQTGAATITVNPLPTASITGTTAVCQNAPAPVVTFTGAAGTAPYTFTYNINGGTSQTITTTSGNSVTLPAPTNVSGTFAYNLVSVRDASSTLCLNAQSGTATVTVNPLPTATIAGTTSVCRNGSSPVITFTGAAGTAPYTFTYNINGGANQTITTTSGNSVTVSAPTTAAGSFAYNLVSVRDASSTLCLNPQSVSATITVNPLPTAMIAGTTAVCQNGTSPVLTFTGATGTAPYTFTYNINGGANQTITTTSGNSVTLSAPTIAAGSFAYNLVSVRDSSSTLCLNAQTGAATITVNPLPTASITGTTAVCQNATAPVVTFTGAAGTAPYTFTYNLNGGTSQTITTTSGNSITVPAPTSAPGTFAYNLVSVRDASATLCLNAQSGTATVTVNPLPTATIAGTSTACQNGASPVITFTGAAGTAPYTFTYNINGGANQTITTTTGNSVTLSAPTSAAGSFVYNLVSVRDATSTNCLNLQSGSATITVHAPVAITTQPVSKTVCATLPVSFSVAATGSGLTYQWYKGIIPIPGATSNTFAITQVSALDAGAYKVEVIGLSPCSAMFSTEVTLTVDQQITITTQPQSQTVCQAANVTFTIGATTPDPTDVLSFQWRKNGVNVGSNSPANTTFTISNVALADAGNYDVVISGPAGYVCPLSFSAIRTLTVNPLPVINSTATGIRCSGVAQNYTITSTIPSTYSWSRAAVAGISEGAVAGQTSSTISETLTNITSSAINVIYLITPTASSCAGPQFTYTVTVNPKPFVAAQTQTICNGTAFSITPADGSGGNIIPSGTLYTWAAPVVTGGMTGGSAQATGQTSISQTLTNTTNTAQTATYTIIPTGPNCTGSAFTLTVTVNPRPFVTNQTSVICSGSAFSLLPVQGVGGNIIPAGTIYTWSAPVVTGGLLGASAQAIGQSAISQTLDNPTNTSQTATYTITPVGPACTGSTFTLTVTVNPKPVVTSQAQTICSGTAFSISPVNGGGNIIPVGTLYTWAAPVTSGGLTGGSAQLTGQASISQTLTNTTNTTQTATYTVTPVGPNCTGTSFTLTVTVSPRPFVAAQTQSICSGASFSLTPANGVGGNIVPAGTLYTWAAPVISGGITGGSAQATGQSTISQLLTNSSNSVQTATYTITPTGPSCTGSTFILTVTVNPKPIVTTLSLDSACTATSPAVALTSSVPGTFSWTIGTVTGGITGHGAASGSTINQVLTNPSVTAMGSVEYLVTPTATIGACVGNTVPITVNVYPPTVGGTLVIDGVASPSNATLVCPAPQSNITGGLTLQNNKVGSIINWQRSTNGGADWINFSNATSAFTYSGLAATTSYRAVLKSGSCDTAYSSIVVISVVPAAPPAPVLASPSTICIGDTSILSAAVGFGTVGIPAGGGDFNNGNPAGWCVDGQCTGSALPAAGNNTNNAPWQETNGPKTFAGVEYDTYDNTKFAIVSGTFGANSTSILTTPTFSLVGLPSATLNYFHAYNLNAGASISIEITTNGGTSWAPLFTASGPAQHGISTSPVRGALQPVGISLNPYLGLPSVKIRFKYVGSTNSSWAIDGVGIPADGMPASFLWTQVTPGPSTLIPISGGSGTTIYASPAATTTYQIATSVAGCPGGMQPVTVTVNPLPTVTPGTADPVCASPDAQTTTLPYGGLSANPTSYSITWVTTPTNSFANIANGTMPGNNANGSISIDVPAGTAPNTYTGWLKVRNGNSCRSDSSSFTLVVRPRPTAVISGTSTICLGQSASFSIPVTGSGTFSGALTNGISFSGVNPSSIPITVSPTATTTYTWGSLTNGTCASIPSDLTGSYTVTVNTPPSISGQTATKTVCLHNPTGFKTVVSGTGVTNSWQVDMGAGWTPIVNGADYAGATTDTLTVLNPKIEMLFYQYRNTVSASGPCTTSAQSVVANLKIRNVWLGTVDNDWQNGANWSDGVPPSVICDTTHILDRAIQPTLRSGTSTNTNLLIYSGADMTLTNQPNTYIEVAASIVNNNTAPGINALNGRLVLNGRLEPQTIKGSLFTQRILNYLTLSNTTAGGASLSGAPNTDTLYISNHLNFGNVNGRTFTTNDNLTLMSRSNLTASVGDLTNGGANTLNIISGKVTVERWFNARKAWRFISVPTSGPQTFRSAWQEKMLSPNDNRFPGYGTTITIGTIGNYVANGFDFYDLTGPSVKTYDPATNTYMGISNSANDMSSTRGYFTFIRGNRSSTTFTSPVTSTVLRTNGPLIQGTRPGVSVGALFNSFANPYASPIDMRKIDKPGAQEFFYLWNPNMSGGFGLGAFQTYAFDGAQYTPVPDDGTAVDNFIQSGQAFFVAGFGTAGNGMVNIEESDKIFQSNMVFRTPNLPENLKVNLLMQSGNTATMLDGIRVDFSDKGNNALDRNDAFKLTNTSENVASLRENKFLAIERRKTVANNDTVFVNMSGLRVTPNYRWSIIMNNLDVSGRTAFLIDTYLDTKTPLALNDTTIHKFTVENIAGSYNQKRFMIVFKQGGRIKTSTPSQLFMTSISAARNKDNSIAVGWKAEHEANVNGYTIERSADGSNFKGIITSGACAQKRGVGSYATVDLSPLAADNFYRLRALLDNGQVVYSKVVKVAPLTVERGITIFPNPVQDKTMHIKFADQEKGMYSIVLNNKLGQTVHQSSVAVTNAITSVDIKLGTYVAAGAYQLQIIAPTGEAMREQIIIE